MEENLRSADENRFRFLGSMPGCMFVFVSLPIPIGFLALLAGHPLAALWLIVLPLVAMTDREREIDATSGTIINRWKLYRFIPIWTRREKISKYQAITCRRIPTRRNVRNQEQEWVALVGADERFHWVSFFDAKKNESCPEAWGYALRLAKAAGLPIRDYPDRMFNRRAPSSTVCDV